MQSTRSWWRVCKGFIVLAWMTRHALCVQPHQIYVSGAMNQWVPQKVIGP